MDIKEYIASGIVELYVLGICSAEEATELDALRLQHPELQAAITQFEIELEAKLLADAQMPPSETDAKILDQWSALQTVATPTNRVVNFNKKKSNHFWLYAGGVAASLAIAFLLYQNQQLSTQYNEAKATIAKAQTPTLPKSDYELILNPAITPVAMYGQGTHAICRCTLYWDKKTGKAYIFIHHLPKSSTSKHYQLWADVDGTLVNVGMVDDQIRGRFIEVPGVPKNAKGFTVTLERAGGAATPTISEIYLKGITTA